jgi:hypothetical protein
VDDRTAPVIGVIGGSGGIGASTFAGGLAAVAGRGVLVDLDALGGGLDVLLGVEDVPGSRWSGVRVDGGHLDPVDLAQGLPRWRGVSVLASDGVTPSCDSLVAVLAAARLLGPVIVDIGRCRSDVHDVLVARCTLVVVLAEAECRGLAGARAVATTLAGTSLGLVTRRGSVCGAEAAALTDLSHLGELAPISRRHDLRRGHLPRSLQRVAGGVLDGVLQ